MNVAEFTEWTTCKVNCKCKKHRSHTNYIFKDPPYWSAFTLKFKQCNHVSNLDRG